MNLVVAVKVPTTADKGEIKVSLNRRRQKGNTPFESRKVAAKTNTDIVKHRNRQSGTPRDQNCD